MPVQHFEPLAGVVDGVNRVFVTSVPYMPGTTMVFVRGVPRDRSSPTEGWVETSPTLGTITLHEAPQRGDVLQAMWIDTSPVAIGEVVVGLDGYLDHERPLAGVLDDVVALAGEIDTTPRALEGELRRVDIQGRIHAERKLVGVLEEC